MKIKEMSLVELKAAYDFVLIDLADLESAANREGVHPGKLGAYDEVKRVEAMLYDELLNRTRSLQ